MKRRDFLKATTTMAVGAVSLNLIGAAHAEATPLVRKSINNLGQSSPEVRNYAKAVALLKNLPPSDPRNWKSQATIHNDFCPHDNWWFLPWHRAYLYYFESVCRSVLQDDTFMLPYWDWTRETTIPAPFLDRNGSLWDDGRDKDGKVTLQPEIVGANVIQKIVSSSALVDLFSSPTPGDDQRQHVSAGLLEFTPHNGVHGTIMGDMGTYMSPLDPIFWMHHCNVDRIWASWTNVPNHLPPPASLWNVHPLAQFYDPIRKQQVSPRTKDTLNASNFRANYDHYEAIGGAPSMVAPALTSSVFAFGPAALLAPGTRKFEASIPAPQGTTLGKATQMRLRLSAEVSTAVEKAVAPLPRGSTRTVDTYLVVGDIPKPARASTAFRVFLNCKDPTLKTPLDDPTYAGTIAFFGDDRSTAEHRTGSSFSINVTEILAKVARAGAYSAGSPIDVAVLPVDLANTSRTAENEVLKPGRVALVAIEAM